ncbi:hypothetical protein D6C84_02066 [Aureobasidium pullulans]|uniref:Uncharacterized protein n=1 Tax=Aureobasidium pullulans TaxID=5580 RepID=A0A4S9Y733_AURPU|nr:hypothetical protein D6C84_02066 [Aureobasidium pullulans]
MLSGQVQSRFKNEKALEPSAIEDLQKLLDETAPGYKVINHRTISGLTFFEMEHMKWDKLFIVPEIWCFLVVGEDPNNAAGCIAAMRLATRYGVRNGKAITTHGRRLNDTRGGIPIVAWCDAFQFKRTYTRGGRITSSYTALQKVRVRYCRRLLERFAAQDSFRNQDWQAIQDIVDEYQDLLHLNGIPRRPNDGYRPRNAPRPPPNHGNNAQNQNLGPADDDDSDDSDDENDFHYNHYRTATSSSARSRSRRTGLDHEDNDLDQGLDDIDDYRGVTADDDDGRQPSPLFEPRSRSDSPEPTTTTNTQPEYDDEEGDMNVDRTTTLNSRFQSEIGDTSPSPRTTATPDPNKPGSKTNPFDITDVPDVYEDDDDMIILYHEIKADPAGESDLIGGGLGVNQVKREIVELDSDTIGDGSSIIQNTPDTAEDDPDIIMGEHVRLVINIDD